MIGKGWNGSRERSERQSDDFKHEKRINLPLTLQTFMAESSKTETNYVSKSTKMEIKSREYTIAYPCALGFCVNLSGRSYLSIYIAF